jgi:ABC-type phosphate transport system substrate-binding protein
MHKTPLPMACSVAVLTTAWAGCEPSTPQAAFGPDAAAPAPVVRIAVHGSSTMHPLISRMAARFQELHREVQIDVQPGGSSRGIQDVRQGLCEIGIPIAACDSFRLRRAIQHTAPR